MIYGSITSNSTYLLGYSQDDSVYVPHEMRSQKLVWSSKPRVVIGR
jgi:hypothetical protein